MGFSHLPNISGVVFFPMKDVMSITCSFGTGPPKGLQRDLPLDEARFRLRRRGENGGWGGAFDRVAFECRLFVFLLGP